MLEDLDLSSIADERARKLVQQLLNVLEDVMADLRRLRQRTNACATSSTGSKASRARRRSRPTRRNRLQGPLSEQERRKPKTWSKGRKTDRIALDREQVVQVDPTHLPPDAVFKGYEDVVVQDVIFRTDNVLFHKRNLLSLTASDLSGVPAAGYRGQCGPGLKSLALCSTSGTDERAEGGGAVAEWGVQNL